MSSAVSSDMLAAFLKVAEGGSVSRAADDLGLCKSVVSKRVAQLEAVVGATLFSRSTRRIALTPAGETYCDFARRALAEMSAGEERLRALRSELTGRIRVSSSVSWGQRVLTRRLAEFLRLHPGVEIDLQLSDRMVDIAYERIDVALRWTSTPPQGLVVEPVAEVRWALVASPAHLLVHGVPREPADLARQPGLGYWREAADDLWSLVRDGLAENVRVRSRFHVDNPEAVTEAALAGLGVALLPDFLTAEALADGRLVTVLPEWEPRTRYGTCISVVAAAERLRIARNRALVDFLRRGGSAA